MDAISSRQAARRLGVSITRFHALTVEHGLTPVLVGEGPRGARFWAPADIDRITDALEQRLRDRLAELDAGRSAS